MKTLTRSPRLVVLAAWAAVLLAAAPGSAQSQQQPPPQQQQVPLPPQQQPQQARPQQPAPGGAVGTSGRSAPANDASLAPDYRLGAGDKLRIEVYKDPQLSQSLQIRPDGKITMPLIGDITAVGLTPIELRDRISASLKDYITNPVVTVIVVEALASNVYVMGEVNKPGPMPMTGPMTVLQALAMAGGFKDFANTKDIRILRRSATGVETIRFNYRDAMKGNAAPVYLRAGDTVIVP